MKSQLKKKIVHSRFLRSLATTITGTSLVFLIQIITTPIISRIYEPVNYGDFAIYTLIFSNISIIATLTLHNALLLTDKNAQFFQLSKTIFILSFFWVFIYSILGIFFGDDIIILISNKDEWEWWLFLVAIAIPFNSGNIIISNWNVRNNQYSSNTKSNVSAKLASRISTIFIGFTPFRQIGLIFGDISMFIFSLTLKIYYNRSEIRRRGVLKDFVNFACVKDIFYTYQKYPLFVFPGQYINQFSSQLSILFISIIYGSEFLGYFTFSISILNIPILLVGNALRPVFYQFSINKVKNNENIKIFSYKVLLLLLMLSLPITIILIFFGEELFSFVFGRQWIFAGKIASILCVSHLFEFLNQSFTSIFFTLKKEKSILFLNSFKLLFRGLVVLYCYLANSTLIEFIIYYTIINVFIYTVQLLYLNSLLQKQSRP